MNATTTTQAGLEVGIHPRVPAESYHALEAASNSRLTKLLRSPAHLRADLDLQKKETDALVLGDAAHALILEPETFTQRYTMAQQCSAHTKAGTQCSKGGSVRRGREWFCGQHDPGGFADGTIVLSADQWAHVHGMRDAVLSHPAAAALLASDGDVEVSAVWRDAETGQLCKARADKLALDFGAIVDLKTTTDASRRSFERAIFNFGYHRQAAFYLDGFAALGALFERHIIIAVEKEPPYAVGVYRLEDGAVDGGRQQIRPLLETYRRCVTTGEWPAYSPEIQPISLPVWAWDQI